MGFDYQDSASRRRRAPAVSTEACHGYRLRASGPQSAALFSDGAATRLPQPEQLFRLYGSGCMVGLFANPIHRLPITRNFVPAKSNERNRCQRFFPPNRFFNMD
jgi:hypothetical protein